MSPHCADHPFHFASHPPFAVYVSPYIIHLKRPSHSSQTQKESVVCLPYLPAWCLCVSVSIVLFLCVYVSVWLYYTMLWHYYHWHIWHIFLFFNISLTELLHLLHYPSISSLSDLSVLTGQNLGHPAETWLMIKLIWLFFFGWLLSQCVMVYSVIQ